MRRADQQLSGHSVGAGIWATRTVFAGSGALFASWVSRIPAVRDDLGATDAGLGLALLCVGLGSLMTMPFSGRLIAKVGGRVVLATAILGSVVVFPALGLAPDLVVLAVVLLLLGAAYGVWDVAMNVAGNAVEQRAGRTLMPGFHACWSIGSVAGAGLGAAAARLQVAPAAHFAAFAVTVGLVSLAATRMLPDVHGDTGAHSAHEPAAPRSRLWRDPRLVALGALTFCAAWAEGAANDWLALLLADERGASGASAAIGFAVFAAAMTVGRLAGDRVVDLLGRVRMLRASAVLAGAGVVLLLTVPVLPAAYLAAVLWGLGIAIAFPLAMSAAGQTPGRGPQAIAAVATIGYLGFLVGPPLLGTLAHQLGLGNALWLVVGLAAGVLALAPAARPLPAVQPSKSPQPAGPHQVA